MRNSMQAPQNTRNRITVRMARRLERKVFVFSFLIQQNREIGRASCRERV